MPDINFNCMYCGQNLDAPEEMTGSSIPCPACGHDIRIPAGATGAYPVQRRPIPPASVRPTGPRPLGSAPAERSAETGPTPGPVGEDQGSSTTRIDVPTEYRMPPRKQRVVFIKRPDHPSSP
jgi:hypothetical protein